MRNEYSARDLINHAIDAKSKNNIKYMRKQLMDCFSNSNEEFKVEVRNRVYNKLKPNVFSTDFHNIDYFSCRVYLNTIIEVAFEEIQMGLDYQISAKFANNHLYSKNTYTVNTMLNNNLNVDALLKTIGYSLDVAEQLEMPVDNLKSGVVGLKVLNRIFNNEKPGEFTTKDLGLCVEVVATAAKYYTDDKEAKKQIALTSALFNLTVDFLTT